MKQLDILKVEKNTLNEAKHIQTKSTIDDNIKQTKIVAYIIHIIIIATVFTLLFFSMKYLNKADDINPFFTFEYTISTILVWTAIYLVLKGLTNHSFFSLVSIVTVEIVFDIINYIVLMVRGSAVTISDLSTFKTAISIIGSVTFFFEKKGILGLLFSCITIMFLVIFRKKLLNNKNKLGIKIIKIIAGISIFVVLSLTNIYKSYSLWDVNATYRTLGTPLTWLRMSNDIFVSAPDNYDKEETSNLLNSYSSVQHTNSVSDDLITESHQDLPNIIVVINESFCDYYNLYNEGFYDPIEYFTELSNSNNVISGCVYSSGFGGQTSNVEYEFLTQNSVRLLPIGSYPFQQYITKTIDSSLVSTLKNYGYKTSAIHPWESFAYSRNKIYKFFQFDSIKFKNDINGLEANFNNEFFTDKSTYNELIKELDKKNANDKVFKYVLTVQNHTGYNNPDSKQITYHSENNKNVYMQLIHESSESLKYLIEYLEKSDEKYILLFFGDHQPNLDNKDNFIEIDIKNYETPFVIWANYDIKEQYNIKTSTVFLQNYLLNAAGITFSSMNNYMEELQQSFPVITSNFCIDRNGTIVKRGNSNTLFYDKLMEYDNISYYRIFDD